MSVNNPRKIQYPFKGGEMVLSEGKVFDRNGVKFEITHFKAITYGQCYIQEVWVKRFKKEEAAVIWKRIINGVNIEEYRIDWL